MALKCAEHGDYLQADEPIYGIELSGGESTSVCGKR